MLPVRVTAAHILAGVALGMLLVATPTPISFAALVIWTILVVRWVKRQVRTRGWWAGADELVIQLATMLILVGAAASAPCKTVDRVKDRRVTLPSQALTLAELREPVSHGLVSPFLYSISAPDDMDDRVVRFPARNLTVGEFIGAIETQTPLRHRFRHCGNGYTILWGGDCSFGLLFDLPHRYPG